MGERFDAMDDKLRGFIEAQRPLCAPRSPLSAAGHGNRSPKGLDTFRLLSPSRVAYLDLTGSGNETSGHLAENGRVTFMFCAFEGPPQIVRLYGKGRTLLPDAPEWPSMESLFDPFAGRR